MKILMATHYFGSHKGGIELVAGRLYEELATMGQQVTWIATNATPPPEDIGCSRAIPLPAINTVEEKTGLPFPIPTFNACQILREHIGRTDILILHDCLYLSNIAGFLMARNRGVPILIVQHIGSVPYRNRLLKTLMSCANAIISGPMLSKAERVVFISETTKRFFAHRRFRNPPETIFNGVDANIYRIPESGETKSDYRSKYNLPSDRPVILFVGRFVEKKGLAVLKAMVTLRPDYYWLFVGWGPLDPREWNLENVEVRSELKAASVAEMYRASDLLVLPSVGEGLPLVIQEALASGLPVTCGEDTATADPGLGEFVRSVPIYPNDNARTAKEFLTAIVDLIESGTASDPLKSDARRAFAISRYSWSKAARRYTELMSQLVEHSSKPVPLPELSVNKAAK
jgi:glycosyltransferase involved in cell wall biosynthesis